MTTAYTSLLGLALPVTGELQGTWGDTVNNSITSLLDTAVAGTTTISTDADVTLSTTTGASNQARQAIILWTANGTVTRNITAPAQSKIYTVINKTAGTQSIVIRGVGPTTGVTITAGNAATVAWNGTDFIDISSFHTGSVTSTGGMYAIGAFSGTYSDGIVMDYTSGTGRLTVGASDGITLYNGGPSSRAALLSISSAGAVSATGNLTWATDNTYDIGASGATRPRNLYLAGTATIGGSTTLSGGTANGVAYLNGSKVITTGAALQFDGTNLSFGKAARTQATNYAAISLTPVLAAAQFWSLVGHGANACEGNILWNCESSGDETFNYTASGDAASRIRQAGTETVFQFASTGTAGTAVGFTTERSARFTTNGCLAIGATSTASAGNRIYTYVATAATASTWINENSTSYPSIVSMKNTAGSMEMGMDSTSGYLQTVNTRPMYFYTDSTYRGCWTAGGVFVVNGTSSPTGAGYLAINGGSSSALLAMGNSSYSTLTIGNDPTGVWLEANGASSARRAVRMQADNGSGSYASIQILGGSQLISLNTSNIERIRVDGGSMSGGWNRTEVLYNTFPGIVFDSNDSKYAYIGYDYSVTRGLTFYTNATTSDATNTGAGAQVQMTMGGGQVNIPGALSKGSGSFLIDHPLPSLTETHNLVHSFIEGPQADNIYRGVVALVNGRAEVNIDTASGMTDGTFVLLNREVQCFTTNESGWTLVKGKVVGNILTIEAQDNTCTDQISWMVIGERQDKHMYETAWTDENGKVIVEPLKEVRKGDRDE